MIRVLLHDGTRERFTLLETDHGLRLRGQGAECDLLAMMRQAGWRIVHADEGDRAVLERNGIWGGRVQCSSGAWLVALPTAAAILRASV